MFFRVFVFKYVVQVYLNLSKTLFKNIPISTTSVLGYHKKSPLISLFDFMLLDTPCYHTVSGHEIVTGEVEDIVFIRSNLGIFTSILTSMYKCQSILLSYSYLNRQYLQIKK